MAIDKINPFKFNNITTIGQSSAKQVNLQAGGGMGGGTGSSVAGVGGIKGAQGIFAPGKVAQGTSYLNNNLFSNNLGKGLAPGVG